MPSVSENRAFWDSDHGWMHAGDIWSSMWGSPEAQWHGTILPRIYHFLPAQTILEIATGMGRWTQFLLDSCDRFIGVDLAARCVEACRTRFVSCEHASFFQNDGRTLGMVEDRSVDFAFTFDSLVHADEATLSSYVKELARTLTPDGVAFIHHSNLGSYGPLGRFLAGLRSRLPQAHGRPSDHHTPSGVRVDAHARTRNYLWRSALSLSPNWRDPGPSAAKFAAVCEQAGLHCIGQELVPWDSGHYLIDCFSTVARMGSKWDRPLRVVRNPKFVSEGRSVRNYRPAYEPPGSSS